MRLLAWILELVLLAVLLSFGYMALMLFFKLPRELWIISALFAVPAVFAFILLRMFK